MESLGWVWGKGWLVVELRGRLAPSCGPLARPLPPSRACFACCCCSHPFYFLLRLSLSRGPLSPRSALGLLPVRAHPSPPALADQAPAHNRERCADGTRPLPPTTRSTPAMRGPEGALPNPADPAEARTTQDSSTYGGAGGIKGLAAPTARWSRRASRPADGRRRQRGHWAGNACGAPCPCPRPPDPPARGGP